MSKKKRKTAKASAPSPRTAPPAVEAPREKGAALLPLAALLAMVVAWAGALGGVAAGNTDPRALFNVDTLHSWMVFRDAFLLEGYPASGWRHGVSLFYFPEYAVLWPLYAAGLDFRAAMIAMTLIYAATSAFGWALVCDSLYGKSSVRRATVFLLHAAPFLILSWARSDIYSLQLRVVFHYGAWTLVPWMLWLFIRALHNIPQGRAGKGGAGKDAASVWQNLFAAAVLLALVVASDLIVVPWFAAPALFSLMCMCVLKRMKWGEFFPFAAAVAFGIAAGLVLKEVPDFPPHRDTESFLSFNPLRTLSALSGMAYEFSRFAGRNPFSALMVCAFAAVALWRLSRLRKGRGKGADSEALKWMGVPDSRAHWFMALFVPVSAAASVAAVAATGNFIPAYSETDLSPSFRYFAPFFFLPLFLGWALLPFSSGAFRGQGKRAVVLCAALIALAASPQALSVRFEKLNPYASPFHQCFAENARRLGWEGGVSTGFFTLPLAANPAAGTERVLPVGVLRRGAGNSRMYVDWTVFNRHWFSGEFQFVVVNDYRGRTSMAPPSPLHPACAPEARDSCVPQGHGALFMDDAAARGAFGDPAEVVECDGLALYHYDPPLRFDFSATDNPDFAQVGRIF